MPHTSRKKKAPHQRRFEAEDKDGWTTIVTTRHHRPPQSPPDGVPYSASTNTPNEYSLEQLRHDYQRHVTIWQASSCAKALAATLDQLHSTLPLGKIDACVCLGIGSPSDGPTRRATLYQLAALQTMLESLRERNKASSSTPIRTFFQDPAFTPHDTALLSSLSPPTTILSSPAAYAHITASTLLYAPHCERPVLFRALQASADPPAVVVCNDMAACVDGPLSASLATDEVANARAFLTASATAVQWPGFDEDGRAFNDLTVYVRRDGEGLER
ncbi:MAG: hypothetical protein M1833_002935 [Piccolia ochrophora]|nr:MAG: hypothetical protein M1833_002935 [Piccolia ochrophora]